MQEQEAVTPDRAKPRVGLVRGWRVTVGASSRWGRDWPPAGWIELQGRGAILEAGGGPMCLDHGAASLLRERPVTGGREHQRAAGAPRARASLTGLGGLSACALARGGGPPRGASRSAARAGPTCHLGRNAARAPAAKVRSQTLQPTCGSPAAADALEWVWGLAHAAQRHAAPRAARARTVVCPNRAPGGEGPLEPAMAVRPAGAAQRAAPKARSIRKVANTQRFTGRAAAHPHSTQPFAALASQHGRARRRARLGCRRRRESVEQSADRHVPAQRLRFECSDAVLRRSHLRSAREGVKWRVHVMGPSQSTPPRLAPAAQE